MALKLRGVNRIERKRLSGSLIMHESPIRNVGCCFLPSERSIANRVGSWSIIHTRGVAAANIPGQTSVLLLLL